MIDMTTVPVCLSLSSSLTFPPPPLVRAHCCSCCCCTLSPSLSPSIPLSQLHPSPPHPHVGHTKGTHARARTTCDVERWALAQALLVACSPPPLLPLRKARSLALLSRLLSRPAGAGGALANQVQPASGACKGGGGGLAACCCCLLLPGPPPPPPPATSRVMDGGRMGWCITSARRCTSCWSAPCVFQQAQQQQQRAHALPGAQGVGRKPVSGSPPRHAPPTHARCEYHSATAGQWG